VTETEWDVDITDVRKVYAGGVVALDGIDLKIEKGSFFSLLGPSGCGKSTLLRILSGLEVPTEGTVYVREKDVQDTAGYRRLTNLVFQRLALFPHMTVAENVAFGPKVHKKSKSQTSAIVAEKLELVELSTMADRYPHEISGGQQQRVAIARALANEPAVLLLDEPLGSLDLKLRVQMQHALKRMQRNSGTTFIYVTHDQLEAFTMSDAIAVMNAGHVEQVGSPIDIYNRPQTEFVATFVGDINVFKGHYDGTHLQGDGLSIRLSEPGEVVTVRPEFVRVAENLGDEVDNRFPGRISEVTFGGSRVRYEITMNNDRKVIAERSTYEPYRPQLGQDIEFGWTAESAVVIPT
jgi:spermidine/putrescine transport system ATP-binding protein